MKIVLWMVIALLAALWTAGAAATAALTGWAAAQVASGAALELGASAAQWPVPEWLALWVDTAALRAAQDALLWGLQNLQQTLPWLGSALGWLVPLVWVLWGLGIALLLLVALALHFVAGRAGRLLATPAPAR
jgi:hypothetical protein